jgi:hypothetical protein
MRENGKTEKLETGVPRRIYSGSSIALNAVLDGKKPHEFDLDFPTVEDGVRGLNFIETVVKSAASDKKWVKLQES